MSDMYTTHWDSSSIHPNTLWRQSIPLLYALLDKSQRTEKWSSATFVYNSGIPYSVRFHIAPLMLSQSGFKSGSSMAARLTVCSSMASAFLNHS